MTEEHDDDCCDECRINNDDFIGKSMFGSHDSVKIVDVDVKKFAVVVTYLKDDEHISFWKERFADFTHTDELMTRYEVEAVGPREAIDAAMRLDAYRKASMMTGWFNCVKGESPTGDPMDQLPEILNHMGNGGLFNRFFFSEPTGIQVVLIENENKLIDKAMEATNAVLDNTGNLAEQWLKEQTEGKDDKQK